MLSRRNIRIKVMQSLYAYSKDRSMSFEDAHQMYKQRIDQSFELYLFALYFLVDIISFASEDEERRKNKYLPNEQDKKFHAKLLNNPITQSLSRHSYLEEKEKEHGFRKKLDSDLSKRLYNAFAKEGEYNEYVFKSESTEKDDIAILHTLLRFLKNHETFNEVLEEAYSNWVDDKSLVVGAVKKTFKALPVQEDYFIKYYPPKDTVKEFGEQLFLKVVSDRDELLDILSPKLENWDAERVAVVDMICLQMATAELLHFPTIPVKVTINEYVDLVKNYSTPKSKDFINGVIDKVMNDLQKKGRINKTGRGLQE